MDTTPTARESRWIAAGPVLLAPQVFDQREDGIVRLLDPEPPPQLRASVREAASVCPTSAISLVS